MKLRITVTSLYYHCPRGKKPARAKMLNVTVCYTLLPNEKGHSLGRWFAGVTANPAYWAVNGQSDPPKIKVPYDGTRGNCVDANVNPPHRGYLRVGRGVTRLAWTQTGSVYRCCGRPSTKHSFTWKGKSYKEIFPSRDGIVSVKY